MKIRSTYLTTAAVLALGVVSPAAADSLSQSIGNPIIEQMEGFDTGNWINRAVNANAIDASVNINAFPNIESSNSFESAVNIGIAVNIDAEGSGTLLSGAGITGFVGNGHLLADVSAENSFSFGNAIVASTEEIKTVAAGAINTGHIASVASAGSSQGNFAMGGSLSDLTYLNGEASSAAAATTNTSAEAFSGKGQYASLGGLSASASGAFAEASSGPATGVYAVNEAFNNATINGSVDIISNGTALAGISTLAAGALNTGSISFGFDGAALNSAINGGD